MSFVWRFLPVTSFWKILALPVTGIYSLLGKRDYTFFFLIQILDTSSNMFLDKEITNYTNYSNYRRYGNCSGQSGHGMSLYSWRLSWIHYLRWELLRPLARSLKTDIFGLCIALCWCQSLLYCKGKLLWLYLLQIQTSVRVVRVWTTEIALTKSIHSTAAAVQDLPGIDVKLVRLPVLASYNFAFSLNYKRASTPGILILTCALISFCYRRKRV